MHTRWWLDVHIRLIIIKIQIHVRVRLYTMVGNGILHDYHFKEGSLLEHTLTHHSLIHTIHTSHNTHTPPPPHTGKRTVLLNSSGRNGSSRTDWTQGPYLAMHRHSDNYTGTCTCTYMALVWRRRRRLSTSSLQKSLSLLFVQCCRTLELDDNVIRNINALQVHVGF